MSSAIKILLLLALAFVIFFSAKAFLAQNNPMPKTRQAQNIEYPEYVWLEGDSKHPYTLFTFAWEQNNSPQAAEIKLSCLGHYQLLVNRRSIYNGPSFAVLPKIYADNIDLREHLVAGVNQIDVICNFIDREIHEYPAYESPALLVGGKVTDSQETHYFADDNAWLTTGMASAQNGPEISGMAGFAEIIDLGKRNEESLKPARKIELPYIIENRPLPLLSYESVPLKKISSSVYDLTKFSVGYLTINTLILVPCKVDMTWGAKLAEDGSVIPYFHQEDTIYFSRGKTTWHQFSRRSGRYIQIKGARCLGVITPGFKSVGMAFDSPAHGLTDPLDQKIFALALNTLKNNIQDHFEDSPVRERAMYVGDTYTMARCLPNTNKNNQLIKEMISRFGQSQTKDGLIPAMTPASKWQFIPSYMLQWLALIDLYLARSNDVELAKEIMPKIKLARDLAEKYETQEGFLAEPAGKQWWNFIDWTPLDGKYRISTPLQIWYFAALKSAANVANLAGDSVESEYNNKAEALKERLIIFAFDKEKKVFADSFDSKRKSVGGAVTNALAGKFGFFKDKGESVGSAQRFDNSLITNTPFSQTWVVEWAIEAGDKDLALRILRKYWGGMVEEGMTTVYESYNPDKPNEYDVIPDTAIMRSYSHAWGCGPLFLYSLVSGE